MTDDDIDHDYDDGSDELETEPFMHTWQVESGEITVRPEDSHWYEIKDANGVAFTPYRVSKRIIEFLGDGNISPTPREVTDYLTKHPDADCEWNGLYFERRDHDNTDSVPALVPGGVYNYRESNGKFPERLTPFELRTDDGVKLGDRFEEVTDRIGNFLSNEEVYRAHKLMYRIGFLMYGPPGQGKTSLIRRVCKAAVPADAVIIWINEKFPSTDFLNKIKETMADRLKVFIFEELANSLQYINTARLLDFLDGESSIDKSIVISTTNYPEKIPGNIIERPSRFDEIYDFGAPKDKEREVLLNYFLQRDVTPEEVKATEKLSIDDIKQVCLLTFVEKKTIAEGVKKMQQRAALAKRAFMEYKGMGF